MHNPLSRLYVVVPAAGTGQRMGSAVPKQYLELNSGQTVLGMTVSKLQSLRPERLVVALHAADTWFDDLHLSGVDRVVGGENRAASVLSALTAIDARDDDLILVHDAVRPCVRVADINRLIDLARDHAEGALLATPVIDTLKRVTDQQVTATVDRSQLWQAQTPQIFRFELLKRALLAAPAATDEASAVEALGILPRICRGRADNLKITTNEDLAMARFIVSSAPQ
ncbi:MAG: 2-C-methyl-D-erythritol 4-phosphate cytidylyltransferase [Gammaproteobacteria bacterium]|jgi:2-C-methyl-D-erythritol 4-phosphate cytidylyltransferase|nr:2-C-methyl-D-erythritol 4-phosphate cytidylyltransferase [Gammaproteobacteria bacterium]MDB2510087.1 2-C-methyl-D-erythritol 4-phosphate cytidylyltransferase [Pseudomonadales bacterium]MDB3978475.1 2-C-methyl-D-erythritol 4-phosphate cytidylyltransferase [Pseudomonadales bacterium]MDB4035366.1 2-C-methyl-D-erythritol 4-phosphate cytidylyltransferase [Pseudomonadales bacterium]MDC1366864.1 2-C-methyl-D-erythritol 4-phosphate cytidylyltransferase [Pseudomonadales bacterium]